MLVLTLKLAGLRSENDALAAFSPEPGKVTDGAAAAESSLAEAAGGTKPAAMSIAENSSLKPEATARGFCSDDNATTFLSIVSYLCL